MVLKTKTLETSQSKFKEVGTTGVFILQTYENYKGSIYALQQNGLRPLTHQEALVLIDQNQELKDQLKGKWFYIDGNESSLPCPSSGFYTFNDKGELTKGKGEIEKTVYVYKGPQPLSLVVHTDYNISDNEKRFVIDGNLPLEDIAQIVVGLPKL